MFVFCRGKSSDQRADLSSTQHQPAAMYRSPPTAIPHGAVPGDRNREDDDDDEEDEAIEFVIL